MMNDNEQGKQDIMQRYAHDLEGMPMLKGSNPKAKSGIYGTLSKQKKPSRKEQ